MITSLAEISLKDSNQFGGKAAALGELKLIDMLVPDGFVIDKQYSLEALNDIFYSLKTDMVAVRSSANLEDGQKNSFAGQFSSYLNVSRDNLVDKVELCFESIYSKSLEQYCKTSKLDFAKVQLSVIIQKMVKSEFSGVCFTKNPTNNNREEIYIETVSGFGEALVSGRTTPNTYIIDNKDKVITYEVNGSYILSKSQLLKICDLAKKIAKHFAQPMDIEWSFEQEKLYILQARPITS